MPESLPSVSMTGMIVCMSSPKRGDSNSRSRACIQLMFSPLWATYRYGWARAQLGNVLVLNREWTRARDDSTSRSSSSG